MKDVSKSQQSMYSQDKEQAQELETVLEKSQ